MTKLFNTIAALTLIFILAGCQTGDVTGRLSGEGEINYGDQPEQTETKQETKEQDQ